MNVARVQAWRSRHPGYWRKGRRVDPALQDVSMAQPIGSADKTDDIAGSPLQELLSAQPAVLIGLIAHLVGTPLQDDIVRTADRLLARSRFEPRRSRPRGSILDPFKPRITRLLETHPYSAQQNLSASARGGLRRRMTILRDYVRRIRPPKRPVYLKLHFAPGECAQVDWGAYPIDKHGADLLFQIISQRYERAPMVSAQRPPGPVIHAVITANAGASQFVPSNAGEIWPHRQKDLINAVNGKLPKAKSINTHDVQCINRGPISAAIADQSIRR